MVCQNLVKKFGGLRIYHHNAPEDIRLLIDEAIEIIATPRYVSYEDHAILSQQRLLPERGK
ncbi:MAG: hypothetical protein J6X63_01925 [Bacteroidales bacterium]|nr:hypothetical protein [Bacteroidales bacterium]